MAWCMLTEFFRALRLQIPGQQSPSRSTLSLSDGHRRSHYLGLEMLMTTPSMTETPSSPLERFWDEPQRHERIAFMMQEFDKPRRPLKRPAPAQHVSGHAPSLRPATPEEHAGEDVKESGSCNASPHRKSKSPSPGFCPGLEIDAQLDVDEDMDMTDVPDLEAIRIAARIK